MRHLDEMTLLLYLEGQFDRARALEVSAHADDCANCRKLLRALERESQLLMRALFEEEEPLPSRLAAFQERARRSMQWIWALTFGLAATGVYALYTSYIQQWQQQLEEAGFGGTNLVGLLIFQGAFWKGWQSMVTLLEVLAMVTLTGLGFAVFRRRLRRGSVLALVLTGLCALMALPPAASATEFRKGETTEISIDETIKGDAYLTGRRLRMDGTVDGDLFVFGQSVDVDGHVTGDVIAFARDLHIRGKVDGNVRAFTNSLTLTGAVGKNVMLFGDALNFESSANIGGSITMFGTSLNLDGKLARDVLFFGDRVGVNGIVGGGIREKGTSLYIGPHAQIDGPVDYVGRKEAEVAATAKLASPVHFTKHEPKPNYLSSHYYVWRVIWAAAYVLFGLVLIVLMPKFSHEAVHMGQSSYGASLGLGVLVLFGVPIAAVIACVTVVGLFIGAATFLVWFMTLYCTQVVTGAVVGQWLMGETNDTWPLVGRMAVGVVAVRLAEMIPYAGPWIKFATILWGIGAISLALYRRFEPNGARGVPPMATPAAPIGMQPAV